MFEKNLFFILEDDGGDQIIELEKKENNIFEEDSIFIHGNKANLVYLDENKFLNYLLEYKLIDPPNAKEKITYPKSFRNIKNILLEPTCSTLKKGEKVNFKIKVKDDNNIEEIVILEGDNVMKLNKEDKLYFNEVKVAGVSDTLNIALQFLYFH